MSKIDEMARILFERCYPGHRIVPYDDLSEAGRAELKDEVRAILAPVTSPDEAMVAAAQKLSTQRVRMHEGHEWMQISCDDEQVWEMIKAALETVRQK